MRAPENNLAYGSNQPRTRDRAPPAATIGDAGVVGKRERSTTRSPNCSNAAAASSTRPRESNHLGESGNERRNSRTATAGSAPAANASRHASDPINAYSPASTNTAHIAPKDQAICGIAPVHPPRDPFGDSSARKAMLAAISAPIATPINTRITNNIHTCVTTADSSASPTNAIRFNKNTRRRPIRSARSPKNNAPTADPKKAAAVNHATSPLLR